MLFKGNIGIVPDHCSPVDSHIYHPCFSFHRYETSNGIQASEDGISYPGDEPETGNYVRTGSYSYEWEGVTYTVTWQADENGFFAEGAHIPGSPQL